MKYILEPITSKIFIEKLGETGQDRKWFIFVYHFRELQFYTIQYPINGYNEEIGLCILKSIDGKLDCSLLIYQSFKRKGYGREFIRQMQEEHQNIQFTVSFHNKESMAFFESFDNMRIIDQYNVVKTKTFGF